MNICTLYAVLLLLCTSASDVSVHPDSPKINLVGNGYPWKGIVEINNGLETKRVCGSDNRDWKDFEFPFRPILWGKHEANVACRTLGYSAVYTYSRSQNIIGSNDNSDKMLEINCNGTESSLFDCTNTSRSYKLGNCSSYINLTCEIDLRITNGTHNNTNEGYVEIFSNNTWMRVCDKYWNNDINANVVCKKLGYPKALSDVATFNFSKGSVPLWQYSLKCNGYEQNLQKCGLDKHQCSTNEAIVNCKEPQLPLNITATAGTKNITVSWDTREDSDCDRYFIILTENPADEAVFKEVTVVRGDGRQYTFNGLEAAKSYIVTMSTETSSRRYKTENYTVNTTTIEPPIKSEEDIVLVPSYSSVSISWTPNVLNIMYWFNVENIEDSNANTTSYSNYNYSRNYSVNSSESSFVIKDLESRTNYTLHVQTRSEKYPEIDFWVNFTTTVPSNSGTDENLVLYIFIGLLVAVIVFIFFLGMILLLVMLNRRSQRKQRKATDSKLWYFKIEIFNTALLIEDNSDWEISEEYVAILKLIGNGNFGEVQLAVVPHDIPNSKVQNYFKRSERSNPTGSSNLVVVKRLKEMSSIEHQMAFLNEFKIMQKACCGNCPNIVSLLGCLTKEDFAVIIEYVPLGDLQSVLRNWKEMKKKSHDQSGEEGNTYNKIYPASTSPEAHHYERGEPKAIKNADPLRYVLEEDSDNNGNYYPAMSIEKEDLTSFAYQIASGMAYLSDLGIIHRDLACRNILMDFEKCLKISDFGLSKESEGEYESTCAVGMPIRWLAPECLKDNQYSQKSDVWSFGICLWEICTFGRQPYSDLSNMDVMFKIPQGYKMEQPKGCSNMAYNTMCQCWELDPGKRENFAEIKHFFETIIEEDHGKDYIDVEVILYENIFSLEESLDTATDEEQPIEMELTINLI